MLASSLGANRAETMEKNMLANRQSLAALYDLYQSTPSPASAVHQVTEAEALFARAQASGRAAADAVARGEALGSVGQRAHACGLYVGAALSMALKPVDVVFGTGTNAAGRQAPLANAGLQGHLEAQVKRPGETGLAGSLSGAHAGVCLAVGAAAGALVGLLGGAGYLAFARDPAQPFGAQLRRIVAAGAADGALVLGTGLALWSGLPFQLIGVGMLRTATAALRGAAVGAGYLAGFAVGLLAAGLVVGLDRPQPAAPAALGL